MPHNSGPAKRDLFPGHGAGKGDADRSPGWRNNYDEINWGNRDPVLSLDQAISLDSPVSLFVKVRPGVMRKVYR